MKFIKYFILLTIAAFIMSCSKDSSNPIDNSNTGSGGNIVTDKGTYSVTFGIGKYFTDENHSSLTITTTNGSGSNGVVSIKFVGKSTGTFNYDDDLDNVVVLSIDSKIYLSKENSGSIKITSYGNVGGQIKGSFSGTFETPDSGEKIVVSKADFSAKRLEDEVYDDDDDDDDNDDDDNDDDELYGSISIKGTLNGQDLNFSYNKSPGYAIITKSEGKQRLDFASGSLEEDNHHTALFSILMDSFVVGNEVDATDPAENKSFIMFQTKDVVSTISGKIKIDRVGQKAGDYFEISASGKIISIYDKKEIGNITEMKVKVYRGN